MDLTELSKEFIRIVNTCVPCSGKKTPTNYTTLRSLYLAVNPNFSGDDNELHRNVNALLRDNGLKRK
jgi:hypothetical protein